MLVFLSFSAVEVEVLAPGLALLFEFEIFFSSVSSLDSRLSS